MSYLLSFFDGDEVNDSSDHSSYLRTIVFDDFVANASETESLQRGPLIRLRTDTASELCDS